MIRVFQPPLFLAASGGQSLTGAPTYDKVMWSSVSGLPAPSYDSTARSWRFPQPGVWRVHAFLRLDPTGGAFSKVLLRVGGNEVQQNYGVAAPAQRTDSIDVILRVTDSVSSYYLEALADTAGTVIVGGADKSRLELVYLGPVPDLAAFPQPYGLRPS